MERARQDLWGQFVQTREPEVKRKLVLQYMDLVRYVVSKFGLQQQGRGHGLEYNDVVHFGVLGLLTAVDRFSPSQGVKFETYAVPRIRGAILDEMRKLDWVPRSIRQTNRKIGKATHQAMQEHGREPLDEEIASKLSMSVEEFRAMVGSGSAVIREVEIITESQSAEPLDQTAAEGPSPLDRLGDEETRATLQEAIERLYERDRTVIALYYYEGLKFTEIAKILHLTDGRVSQIHSDVLRHLRSRLLALEVR
jgi:RNA polymerase sigma factor for flagellar operon FliA